MTGRRALLHCNAGPEYGMGHLARTVAVAQAAQASGWVVQIVGDIDEASQAVARRLGANFEVVGVRGDALRRAWGTCAPTADVVHLDTYWEVPGPTRGNALVSNMQDGLYGVRDADLAIDANLSAERSFVRPESSRFQLAGIDVAVVREQVFRQRRLPEAHAGDPRALVVMGGTDPHGLTARVVQSLGLVPGRWDVTVVDPRHRQDVLAAARASPHDVRVRGFVEDLPALARCHDVVVTAEDGMRR